MCEKRKKNKKKKKTKKLSHFLKSHISGMPEAISLKFRIWSTEVGGNVHSKICLVSSRQHRVRKVRKVRFLSSCQYTHGVARRLLGPHDTLPCVLMIGSNRMIFKGGILDCTRNFWGDLYLNGITVLFDTFMLHKYKEKIYHRKRN